MQLPREVEPLVTKAACFRELSPSHGVEPHVARVSQEKPFETFCPLVPSASEEQPRGPTFPSLPKCLVKDSGLLQPRLSHSFQNFSVTLDFPAVPSCSGSAISWPSGPQALFPKPSWNA